MAAQARQHLQMTSLLAQSYYWKRLGILVWAASGQNLAVVAVRFQRYSLMQRTGLVEVAQGGAEAADHVIRVHWVPQAWAAEAMAHMVHRSRAH